LYPDGKWPAASERLNKSAKYGATKWMTCFKTDVGPNSANDVIDINRQEGRERDAGLNAAECRRVASLMLERAFATFSVNFLCTATNVLRPTDEIRPKLPMRDKTD